MIITIKTNRPSNANPPHNGAVTHHQDQLMNPVSFKVIKIKNIRPRIPIPPEELELLLDIVFLL
jgi:hypothetical protein